MVHTRREEFIEEHHRTIGDTAGDVGPLGFGRR